MKQFISRRFAMVLGASAIAAAGMLTGCSATNEKPATESTSSTTPPVVTTEKAVAPAPQNPNDGWDGRPNNGGRTDFNDQGSLPNKTVPDTRGPVGQPSPQSGNN